MEKKKILYKLVFEKLNAHQSYYASCETFCQVGGIVEVVSKDGWKLETISRVGGRCETPGNFDLWRVGN